MRLGIIGLPQSGKTTIFNALTRGHQPTTMSGGRFEVHTGASEKFAHSGGGYTRTLFYPPGGKFIGTTLTPLIEFLDAAKDTRIAEQLDWQLRLK